LALFFSTFFRRVSTAISLVALKRLGRTKKTGPKAGVEESGAV